MRFTPFMCASKFEPDDARLRYLSDFLGRDVLGLQDDTHGHYVKARGRRLEGLYQLLSAPSEGPLWAVRGGSGTSALMPALQSMMARQPRQSPHHHTLIGYSDLTPLLLHANRQWGWTAIHGPMILDYAFPGRLSQPAKASMRELLSDGKTHVSATLSPLRAVGGQFGASMVAPISGGNLSLLSRSIGTPWAMQGRGQILFIEEVGEPAYRIMELLVHLVNAGAFSGAVALLLGDLGAPEPTKTFYQTFLPEFLEIIQASCPELEIFTGFPSGHCPNHFPVHLGAPATLMGDGKGAPYGYRQEIHIPQQTQVGA